MKPRLLPFLRPRIHGSIKLQYPASYKLTSRPLIVFLIVFTFVFVFCLVLRQFNDYGEGNEDYVDWSRESETENEAKVGRRVSILVTSVPRSGTTMMYRLLATLSQRSFGAYEPLYPFTKLFRQRRKERVNSDKIVQKVELEASISNLLSCNFNKNSAVFPMQSQLFREWLISVGIKNMIPQFLKRGVASYRDRVSQVTKICRAADLKVVKVIKLAKHLDKHGHASVIKSLMSRDPNLYVIGLIRDPRAIYKSRRQTFPSAEPLEDTCSDVLNIYETLTSLKPLWPNRVMAIKYESLAKHPFRSMTEIASKTGLKQGSRLNRRTIDWIVDNMLADEQLNEEKLHPFEVMGRNASAHVLDWSGFLDLKNSTICSSVIELLRY